MLHFHLTLTFLLNMSYMKFYLHHVIVVIYQVDISLLFEVN